MGFGHSFRDAEFPGPSIHRDDLFERRLAFENGNRAWLEFGLGAEGRGDWEIRNVDAGEWHDAIESFRDGVSESWSASFSSGPGGSGFKCDGARGFTVQARADQFGMNFEFDE